MDHSLLFSYLQLGQYEGFLLFFAIFLALAIGHAIGDFPLQGAFLALTKDPNNKEGVVGELKYGWLFSLLSHCLIQAGIVWIITGSLLFCVIELVLHIFIDYGKFKFKYSFITDQIFHYACKLAYAAVITFILI